MKKHLAVLMAMPLMFVLAAPAQTSGSGSSGQNSGTSSTPPTTQSTTPTDQNSNGNVSGTSNSGSPGSQSGDMSQSSNSSNNGNMNDKMSDKHMKGEKTLEGCVIEENNAFYVEPKHGDLTRLSSSQDLTPHVGHHVKLHGMEQKGDMMSSNKNGSMDTNSSIGGGTGSGADTMSKNGSTTDTGNRSAAGSSTTASGANSGSSNSQTASNNSGNSASGMPQSDQSAGSMSNMSSTTGRKINQNKQFVVDRVEMVSETCPIKNKNMNHDSMNNNSNPK